MLNIKSFTSPNYALRDADDVLQYIIIHYTEVEKPYALDLLSTKDGGVSAHYLVDEDGEVIELVSPSFVAWHAGVSSWNGLQGMNKYSIGIELVNSGRQNYPEMQIVILTELLQFLCKKYNISQLNIIGHSDVAPSRKIDPGPYFPWQPIAKKGWGLYHTVTSNHNHGKIICEFGDKGEKILRLQKQLITLGYSLMLTGCFDVQMNYVVRSFISHFAPHIILNSLGIEHYWQADSKYFWNKECSEILEALLITKKSLQ